MKTFTTKCMIKGTGILLVLIVFSLQGYSQQLITFTNGAVLKAWITYQTKDTIKYYKDGNLDVIFVETMDRVSKITPVEPYEKYNPANKATLLPADKEYWKYKKGLTTGGVLMGTGAVLTIAGVIGWSASNDADNPNEVLGAVFSVMGMIIGSGLFVTGGIITIVNASNLSAYKREHSGLSINLKANQKMTGVSLVYRF
jgi:hypothetical protein